MLGMEMVAVEAKKSLSEPKQGEESIIHSWENPGRMFPQCDMTAWHSVLEPKQRNTEVTLKRTPLTKLKTAGGSKHITAMDLKSIE